MPRKPKFENERKVLTCLEAGCPLASEDTQTCEDIYCLAHPSNIEVVGRGNSETKEEVNED